MHLLVMPIDWLKRYLRAVVVALVTPVLFSLRTGHFISSLARKAVDPKGNALPWYTYPAIDFLAERDFTGKLILEFGGGQSTIWWAERSAKVITIEQDEDWAARIRRTVGQNVEVFHVPVDRETRTVEPIRQLLKDRAYPPFDLVIIDGHLRQELVAVAFEFLAENGAVVMDNAEGRQFQEMLQPHNCMRVDFYGFPPGVSRRHSTSIAFRAGAFIFENMWPINKPER